MRPIATLYRNPDGAIFQLRVVTSKGVTTIPCDNTQEKTIRKFVRDIWGRVQWLDVTITPSEKTEDNPPPIQIDLDRW